MKTTMNLEEHNSMKEKREKKKLNPKIKIRI